MKPIETRYAGCRFRSRLEARWAVFFDTLGVKWLYEPEGFVVGHGDPVHTRDCVHNDECVHNCVHEPFFCGCPYASGTYYLPDFYLPEHGTWVEVRGDLSRPGLVKTIIDALDPWAGGNIPIPYNGTPDVYNCPSWCRGGDYHNEWHDNSNDNHGTSYGILVLSDIPEPVPGVAICHDFFYAHKGVVREHYAFCSPWSRYDSERKKIYRPLLKEMKWNPAWAYQNSYDATTGDSYPNEKLESHYVYGDVQVKPIHIDQEVLDAYRAARSARFEHGESG